MDRSFIHDGRYTQTQGKDSRDRAALPSWRSVTVLPGAIDYARPRRRATSSEMEHAARLSEVLELLACDSGLNRQNHDIFHRDQCIPFGESRACFVTTFGAKAWPIIGQGPQVKQGWLPS